MRKLFITICICFISIGFINADSGLWTVSGTVIINKPGMVYLSLLNESGFKDHYRFLKRMTMIIGPEELKTGTVSFEFTGIPNGEYALSAFLDENGNGKLDSGIFGPVEPWGNYRGPRPSMRGPKWAELFFSVDCNIDNVNIEIE